MTRRETPDIMGAVLAGSDQPAASSLRISEIRRDGGTQPREGLDENHLADLEAALEAGETMPPVDVMFDGTTYWLWDGYHRVELARRAGKYTVMATIHQGDQAAAQWASFAANTRHGLKRTNADKKRAVQAALRHPNAANMSNREIARHVGVDESMVRDHRAKLESTAGIPQSTTRTGADGRTINTERIGTSLAARMVRAERAAAGASQAQPAKPDRRTWWRCSRCGAERQWIEPGECTCGSDSWTVLSATATQLEAVVRATAARFYVSYETRYVVSDMRANAKTRDGGGFWRACERAMPANIGEWRRSELAQAINNVASQMETESPATTPAEVQPVGKPLMEVMRTDAELADDAWRADIASRQAAADEAERQVVADRHAHLVHVLGQAIAAMPEIGDLIGQHSYCVNQADSLGWMRKEILALAAKQPAPAAPPPAAELPAELAAAGWTLQQSRGKWYASVPVPSEPEPIRTIGRANPADTIRDAEYMHKNLRIGVAA